MTLSEQYIVLARRSYRLIYTGLALIFVFGPSGVLGIAVGLGGVIHGDSPSKFILAGSVAAVLAAVGGLVPLRFGLREGNEAVAILKNFIADSGIVDKNNVLHPAVMTGSYRFGAGTVVKDGQEVVAELVMDNNNVILRIAPTMSTAVTL